MVHPDNALSPCVWIWLVLLTVRAWLLCPLRGVCRGQLGFICQALTRQDDLSQIGRWDSCMYITCGACIWRICSIQACYAINVVILFIWASCESTTLRSQSNAPCLSLSPANLWAPVSGLKRAILHKLWNDCKQMYPKAFTDWSILHWNMFAIKKSWHRA